MEMEKEVRRGDQRVLLLMLLARNLLSRIAGAPAQQSIVLLSEGAGVYSNSSSSSSYFKWLLNLSSLASLVGSALAFFPYFKGPYSIRLCFSYYSSAHLSSFQRG